MFSNNNKKDIITFYDCNYNGKTGKKKNIMYNNNEISLEKYSYGPCVLEFENNLRINIYDTIIQDDTVFYKNNEINFNEFNKIIFNYGEDSVDGANADSYLDIALKIYKICLLQNENIKVFNNPLNHLIIVDTLVTYQTLKECKYVKVPSFSENKDFCNDTNNYPLIVSMRQQSGGKGKYLLKCKDELENYDSDFLNGKVFSKFYDSFFPDTLDRIAIRIFVFNNHLVDFIVRYSKDWNIHCSNHIIDNYQVTMMDQYFKNYFNEEKIYIQNILDELFSILGCGLYCHDCIFVDNKLIFCELGYKTISEYSICIHKLNNINIKDKICLDPIKVHEIYKKLLNES